MSVSITIVSVPGLFSIVMTVRRIYMCIYIYIYICIYIHIYTYR